MNRRGQSLVIRADASAEMGTGHVMRCLALAQAWKDAGGEVTFACAEISRALAERLASEAMGLQPISAAAGSLEDAEQTAEIAARQQSGWIVLDGYQFGADYQRRIKELGLSLLAVDDYGHAAHYYADYVLNPNGYASRAPYASCEPGTRLLLGTRFVLLRREFRKWRGWQRPLDPASCKLLVTLGGSDPDHVTLKAASALKDLRASGLEAVVVAGGTFGGLDALRAVVADLGPNVELRSNVADMPELMAWADMAISAAGTTCWELAFMQLPAALIILADNQIQVAEHAARAGSALNLGRGAAVSPASIAEAVGALLENVPSRKHMASYGAQMVDGLGVDRIVNLLTRERFTLRRVRLEDARQLWDWRSDPDVARVSFSTGALEFERHVAWLTAKLQDTHCGLFLAETPDGAPIGQVRFDVHGGEADISVSVGREHRGKGFGSALIREGCDLACDTFDIQTVHAYIKPDNTASIQAFTRAGFGNREEIIVQGNPALRLTLHREPLQ